MIPNDFIQTLLARVDIVDVIDRYVPLKKAGANYAACCPFHSEKTPSFTVSPTKQFYHCFGCGAHGTAIGFLMEYGGKSFPDAVDELARDAGLDVPKEERPGERERRAESVDLTDHLLTAAHFYRAELKDSPRAIDYLKRRGLTGEIAARFGIGYAPDAWQPCCACSANYEDPMLEAAGLVIAGDGDKRYDRFRDRIMFPIHDHRGHVIGFGGRVIDRRRAEVPEFAGNAGVLEGARALRPVPRAQRDPRRRQGGGRRRLHGCRRARAARRRLRGRNAGHVDDTRSTCRSCSARPIRSSSASTATPRAGGRRGARSRTRWRFWPTARTRASCSCPTARIRTISCASAARARSRMRRSPRRRCREFLLDELTAQHPPDTVEGRAALAHAATAVSRAGSRADPARAVASPACRTHRPAGNGVAHAAGFGGRGQSGAGCGSAAARGVRRPAPAEPAVADAPRAIAGARAAAGVAAATVARRDGRRPPPRRRHAGRRCAGGRDRSLRTLADDHTRRRAALPRHAARSGDRRSPGDHRGPGHHAPSRPKR